MKAVNNGILVKSEKAQDAVLSEKLGGLTIPVGTNTGELETYKVLSVGKKIEDVKEGDIVYTYPNPGHKFKEGGEEYRLINITDILVIKD